MKKPPITPGERRALLFFGALLLLAIGARAAEGRRLRRAVPVADSLALERQLAAVEGARKARREEGKPPGGKGRGRKGRKAAGGEGDSSSRHASGGAGDPPATTAWSAHSGAPRPFAAVAPPARPVAPAPPAPPASSAASPPPAKVDLDRAPYEEILRLPWVGPTLAARIVADRADHGPFGSLEGLGQVRGVGPALLKRLAPHVTFSAPPRRDTAGRPERRTKRAPP